MRSTLRKLLIVPVLALALYLTPEKPAEAASCYCWDKYDCWECYPFLYGEPVSCNNHGCLWL